ncbi:hypothetical protein NFI96_022815, partial [Prochilodus magdalenae]
SGPIPAETAVQKHYKHHLKNKFQCLNDVITNQGNPTLLNEIYTELYITEGEGGGINKEHEVRQIEAVSRRTTEDTPINCNDIFKPLSEQDKPIRTVLTKGVAGIGKTVSVQKFILDWAEDKANQDLQFIFPLPFRELNLMTAQKLSLLDLLHKCVQETGIETSSLHKALFMFDGLDECRLPLDFQSSESVCDVTVSASVDVLLINLIKGNLLPSALIWITSRPAAADQIPSEYVDRVTEVRGFTDPQKEEYFRRRISDEELANRIISHLKTSRSLYIMCHIPVFCWISATVLKRVLGEAGSGEIPKTLTQMYTHFLIIQTQIIREKYTQIQNTDEEILLKLGHLAFQQLMRGNLIFYEEDLRECGIHIQEASVYSGVCTQIFREESGLPQSKVYCFVHLSVQEHLAALYTHMTFMIQKRNVLRESQPSKVGNLKSKEIKIIDLHKTAVDQALQSKNGHLDLFLRFLLGLSLESNQMLLQELTTQTGSSFHSKEETVQYVKKKIRENPSTEKSINLFHCLSELGDHSLVEEIQQYLKSSDLNKSKLSSSQWSAVVFVLLTSGDDLDEFVLRKYGNSEEVLLKLLPVVAASKSANLAYFKLTKRSSTALTSVFSSESSSLRELSLSETKLGASRMKLLSSVLNSPHCKLESLRLCNCKIADEGCAVLASALKSNTSHLRVMNLSVNKLCDSGVKLLSAGLEDPHCKLETLMLYNCKITDEGCAALAAALKSNPSHLRELNLSWNDLRDTGIKLISAALENPHCKLEILRLCSCKFMLKGCAALASALKLNPSHLRELDLHGNHLESSGVKLLSAGLKNPLCKLETLKLSYCYITDEGCAALASALKSNPSHLRVLDLSANEDIHKGRELLLALKQNEHYRLQELGCGSCFLSCVVSSCQEQHPDCGLQERPQTGTIAEQCVSDEEQCVSDEEQCVSNEEQDGSDEEQDGSDEEQDGSDEEQGGSDEDEEQCVSDEECVLVMKSSVLVMKSSVLVMKSSVLVMRSSVLVVWSSVLVMWSSVLVMRSSVLVMKSSVLVMKSSVLVMRSSVLVMWSSVLVMRSSVLVMKSSVLVMKSSVLVMRSSVLVMWSSVLVMRSSVLVMRMRSSLLVMKSSVLVMKQCVSDEDEEQCVSDEDEEQCVSDEDEEQCVSDVEQCVSDEDEEQCVSDEDEEQCVSMWSSVLVMKQCVSDEDEEQCVSDEEQCVSNEDEEQCVSDEEQCVSDEDEEQCVSNEEQCVSDEDEEQCVSDEDEEQCVSDEDEEHPIETKRSDSPEPSCVSMRSDASMNPPMVFKDGDPSSKLSPLQRSDSPEPSCVSMRSDASMNPPMVFKDGNPSSELSPLQRSDTPEPSMVSMRSDASMNPPMVFKDEDLSSELSLLQIKRSDSPKPSCVSMRSDGSMNPPMVFKDPSSEHSLQEIEGSDSPGPSCVSRRSNESMNHTLAFKDEDPSSEHSTFIHLKFEAENCSYTTPYVSPSHRQGHTSDSVQVQENFRAILKERFQCLNEVISNQGNPTLLNKIYTELYITEGDRVGINNEHEVRQIEAASRRTTTEDTPIKCNDIFKPLSEQDKPIRTVLTKGVAGIGKTVSVQKFILDWAEDKAHQDLQFIFPLPFRELNLMKDQRLSLLDLLHKCVQETGIETSSLHKALFVFDGLDECRLPLDFQSSESVWDVTVSASVDVLLINLIKGNLLPSALIWITSRPAAADQIPSEYVDRVTEVRGFTDPQKEEYFRRRISDEDLANRVISHLKTSRSLYIMCHIPVFCWISATVLERLLGEAESGEIPKTLTQMYTHFLIIQTQIIREKYTQIQETDEEILLKLGHLAFQQLMRGNLIFYEEDLRECGIHVQEASVYSGVCTQIFREESGLLQSKVYCFVHLSVQEHLAALYVHLTFMIQKTNVLRESQPFRLCSFLREKNTISDLHKTAVKQALQSTNGHLDLFLRFLLGLSLMSNHSFLQGLETQTGSSSCSKEETVQYIKKKIRENSSPEKFMNLFHCLNELGDHSLVEEVEKCLQRYRSNERKLSSSQWSAVVYIILSSEEKFGEFILWNYGKSDYVLLKLLPVVAESRTANLLRCELTKKSCAGLVPVLISESSRLRKLHISQNKIGDSGVKLLTDGLKNPLCKLESLRLRECNITTESCAALASALKSNPLHLRELHLSKNNIGDSGVKLFCEVLGNPLCKLEALWLWDCNITDEACVALTAALKLNPSHLMELNLHENLQIKTGLELLLALKHDEHYRLKELII